LQKQSILEYKSVGNFKGFIGKLLTFFIRGKNGAGCAVGLFYLVKL